MTPLAWMIGASLGSWLVVTTLARNVNPEALFGMAGPLVSACATWIAAARAYRVGPARVTRVMIIGFCVKMVFFGVFLAAMLRGLALRPTIFVVSFTGYFIALYAMEAVFLHRLSVDGSRAAPPV